MRRGFTVEEDPDLIVIYECWKKSFVRNIIPNEFYKPRLTVLDRIGIERKVYWLNTCHTWRPSRLHFDIRLGAGFNHANNFNRRNPHLENNLDKTQIQGMPTMPESRSCN